MDIKVSIIIPVYNVEKHLCRCIDSILFQSLEDIEIILIDDGSTDNSGFICDEYQKKDDRVKVMYIQNSGPSNARNIGIAEAMGEYIGFVDSDDYIDKDMYEQLYNQAKIFDSQMCCSSYYYEQSCSSYIVNLPLKPYELIDKNYISLTLAKNLAACNDAGLFSLWNKIYKREFLIQQGIRLDVKRNHGEDWVFNLELYKRYSSISYINKPYYHYIQTETGLYNRYRENYFDLCLDGRRKMLEFFRLYNIMPNEYVKRSIKFYYEFIHQIDKIYSNTSNIRKRKELVNEITKNSYARDCCGEILKMNSEQLIQSSMSRKDKIIPFILKNFPSAFTYFIFSSSYFRRRYF